MGSDLTTWFLVFTRCSALLAALPFFSVQNFPIQLRVALGAAAALLVAPTIPAAEGDGSFVQLVCGMAMEAGIGLLLGFVCRIFFFGLEAAGQLIASEMGLMLTPQFNPLTHSSITAPGLLLFWMSTMILLSLDLHHWMLAGFQASYQLAPVGRFVLGEALALDLVRSTGSVFRIALQLSAPVLAASFLVTVVFSLLSRAVPQMNTFAESFPVRTLCGLLVFGLSCTLMGQYAANHLRRIPEDLHRVANLLGGG